MPSNFECSPETDGTYKTINDYISTCSTSNTYNTNVQTNVNNILQFNNLFENQSAIATDMKTTIDTIITNNNNGNDLLKVLDLGIQPYKEEEKKLQKEIKELQNKNTALSTAFEENIKDLHINSDSMLTAQDWVIAALMISYLAASLFVLAYIGISTNWNKKSLLFSFIGLLIITVILYIILHSFA
jgi:hypothetical protein